MTERRGCLPGMYAPLNPRKNRRNHNRPTNNPTTTPQPAKIPRRLPRRSSRPLVQPVHVQHLAETDSAIRRADARQRVVASKERSSVRRLKQRRKRRDD